MRKLKVAELILDFELYPRNNVDSHNVTNLVNALSAGVELPPPIIDRKSKRVADGFHRVKAYLRAFGEDAEIEVVEKDYKTESELFLDAMRYNASHGAKLDPCDRTHCVLVSERLGIPLEAVAGALNMPADKLGNLRETRTAKSGKLTVPIKRTIGHKAGQRLTKRQLAANDRLSGMNQAFYVNQLIELIESDLLDVENETLMAQLEKLSELLGGLLVAK